MNEPNRHPLADHDPTRLFEEYLSALDAGDPVDVDEIARRAGAREPELRRRVRVYQALQELSDAIQPLPHELVEEPSGSQAEPESTDSALAADASLRELGRFRNLVQIGHGASSRVLLADDPRLARRVALKVFSPRELGVRDARAWMQNEGRSLARLEHPGVVRVFDVDEADGHAFIAMEYVRGPALRAVLDCMTSSKGSSETPGASSDRETDAASEPGATAERSAPDHRRTAPARSAHSHNGAGANPVHANGADARSTDDPDAASAKASLDAWTSASALALASLPARVRLASKLARALEYCHEQGVIHRDVKPGNILLVDGDEPKLIDFGLAHTGIEAESLNQVTQRLVGTPAYLAPEQVDGSRTGASPASDQFSLGTVLYELFTLKNPFQKETRGDTMSAISRADPPPPRKWNPSIPSDLERIVLHSLQRLPKDRYASVGDLADDLDAFLELRAISLQPPSPLKLTRLWVTRHRRDVVLAGLLFVVASMLALWVLDARARRALVSRNLAAQSELIGELDSPAQFEAAYPVIYWMERTAHDLDREVVASIVGNRLEQRAQLLIDACSQRLAKRLERAWKAIEKADQYQRRDGERRIMASWGGALGMDCAYCPDCPYNERDRQRGRVDLPTAAPGQSIRVREYVPRNGPMVSVLEPIDSKRGIVPGVFRFELADSEGKLLQELDFEVLAPELHHALEVRDLLPAVRSRMSRVERGSVKLGPNTLEVGPLWIMGSPVRWRDLELAYESSKAVRMRQNAERDFPITCADDDPAYLTYQEAQAFARAVGARIPTLPELLVTWRKPETVPPEVERIAAGELVTGLAVGGQRAVVRYDVRNGKDGFDPSAIQFKPEYEAHYAELTRDGPTRCYTFRLAFSATP